MIVVVVSVDWEGRSLLPENLQLIAAFRRRHADVPLQHLLNPAYYTRPGSNATAATDAIRQALLPHDEHGMHIHAWRSLLAAAGVAPRGSPRFLEDDPPVPKAPDDWGFYPPEDGYDVPLEQFELEELDRVLKTSLEILTTQGFQRAVTFRAGGWMSGPKVQSALAKNGFEIDCSAVDPQFTIRRFGNIALARWLTELWPSTVPTSQPYRSSTPAGALWQVPNNAALVDYTATEELVAIFERNVARWRETSGTPCFISTGFHQETARTFLYRLDNGIDRMRRIADEHKLPIVFTARPQDFLGD